MKAPEYPEVARRYNAQATLRVTFHVKANGNVDSVEVSEGNPAFVDSVKRVAKSWKFEQRPEASTVRLAVPFRLQPAEDGSSDTVIRERSFTPQGPADVKRELKPGFEYVRLLIDASGKVVGRFVESCEPADFAASADAIIDALKFAPLEPGGPPQPHTVNSFLVDYASDGVIRVQQRNGEPR